MKLAKRAIEAKARQRRIEQMTPDQRERYEAWQRTHRPGSAAKRAAARVERKQNAWFRGIVARLDEVAPAVDIFE